MLWFRNKDRRRVGNVWRHLSPALSLRAKSWARLGARGKNRKRARGYCDRPRPGARLGRERFEDEGNNAKKHAGPGLASDWRFRAFRGCLQSRSPGAFGVAQYGTNPHPWRRRFRTVPQSQSRLHHMVFRFQISKPARELGREIRLQGVSFPRKGRERGAGQTSGSWDGTNGWKYTRTDDGGWSMITMDVLLGVDVTPASRFVLLKFERSPGA